jgi:hypothetical protein
MPKDTKKTGTKVSTSKQKKTTSPEPATTPAASSRQVPPSAAAGIAVGVPLTPSAPETTKVTREERHRMIAEAAYYLALKRGWNSDPLRNWLDAEKQIDEQLRREGRL